MKNHPPHQTTKYLTLITQLGLTMISSILLCFAIGLYLDRKFNLHGYAALTALVIGVILGFTQLFRIVTKLLEEDTKEEKNEKP